jgi:hypothetical protein
MSREFEFDLDAVPLDDIPDVAPPRPAAPPPAPRAPMEVGPPRDVLRRRRRLAYVGTWLWLAAQVLALGVRTDFERLGAVYVALHIALPLALATATLFAALWPGRTGLGVSAKIVVGLSIASIAAYVAVALAMPEPYAFVAPTGARFWRWTVGCFDVTFLMGTVPLLFLVPAIRRTFVAGAFFRCAAIGLSCGLAGTATIGVHCDNISRFHVLVSHGLPAVLLALIGGLLVSRIARV